MEISYRTQLKRTKQFHLAKVMGGIRRTLRCVSVKTASGTEQSYEAIPVFGKGIFRFGSAQCQVVRRHESQQSPASFKRRDRECKCSENGFPQSSPGSPQNAITSVHASTNLLVAVVTSESWSYQGLGHPPVDDYGFRIDV